MEHIRSVVQRFLSLNKQRNALIGIVRTRLFKDPLLSGLGLVAYKYAVSD